jgi:hypothetical protein
MAMESGWGRVVTVDVGLLSESSKYYGAKFGAHADGWVALRWNPSGKTDEEEF